MALVKGLSDNQLVFVVVMGLAVLSGFFLILDAATTTLIIVIGGVIIGLMNIKKAESTPFLIASIAVAGAATALAVIPVVGGIVQTIVVQIALVVAPAAAVVAVMALFRLMKK